MLVRTVILYCIMTVCAVAFHENTYAVWELKEDLQIRIMNLWELFQQLEYVEPHQRDIVYERNTAHKTRDTTHNRRVNTARSLTTLVAYILYMDLLYILTGIFISAIAISVVLGNINGTLLP